MHQRRQFLLAIGGTAAAAVMHGAPAAARRQSRTGAITHGFNARVVARPGMGNSLVDLLFAAPAFDSPDCLLFLIGRSASNRDVIFVTEGWRSKEAHQRFRSKDAVEAYVERLGRLVERESTDDEVPLGGKAVFG